VSRSTKAFATDPAIGEALNKVLLSIQLGNLEWINKRKYTLALRQLLLNLGPIFLTHALPSREILEAKMASASASASELPIPFTTTKAFWDHISSANQDVFTFQG